MLPDSKNGIYSDGWPTSTSSDSKDVKLVILSVQGCLKLTSKVFWRTVLSVRVDLIVTVWVVPIRPTSSLAIMRDSSPKTEAKSVPVVS